jgi:GNAT superfamily N-acetyltransferase
MSSAFSPLSGVTYRSNPRPSDRAAVRRMVAGTGFFSPAEVAIAVELVDDRLSRGRRSDYRFLFAERKGLPIAYTCYGAIDGTLSSYDLYWIVVRNDLRKIGIGRDLMKRTEDRILRSKGSRVYVDTSSRDQYAPTRAFYVRCGYRQAAVLPDFYAPGDGKIIYEKILHP